MPPTPPAGRRDSDVFQPDRPPSISILKMTIQYLDPDNDRIRRNV
jgi:hypothetical protein